MYKYGIIGLDHYLYNKHHNFGAPDLTVSDAYF